MTRAWGKDLRAFGQDAWPVLMVWSALVVLPVGRVVEVSVASMALASGYLLVKRRAALLGDDRVRLFTAVFLAMWVPMILSLPDSVRPSTTLSVAANHLRFYFCGLFIIWALSTELAWERLLRWSAWLLTFWVADGLLQLATGYDVFGFEVDGSRINALFGRRTPKYAIALATFAPLAWEYAFRRWRATGHAALVFATVLVVIGAGTRSAWITICFVLAVHVLTVALRNARHARVLVLVVVVGSTAGSVAMYQTSERFEDRVDRLLSTLVQGTSVERNSITTRFSIWRGAWNMFSANAVNGVGARSFRYAYADYALPDDPYRNREPPMSPAHSHQLLLEIASETGLLGLLGLLLAAWWLGRAGWRSLRDGERWLLAPGLCLLGATFPFNSHMAVYSAFWSQVLWWLVAVSCAACAGANSARSRSMHPARG